MDHNSKQLFDAVRNIFITMILCIFFILLASIAVGVFFKVKYTIKSVMLAGVGAVVLLALTLLVLLLATKYCEQSIIFSLSAFFMKIVFLFIYLFLIKNYVSVNNHFFSAILMLILLISCIIEAIFLSKAKYKYV